MPSATANARVEQLLRAATVEVYAKNAPDQLRAHMAPGTDVYVSFLPGDDMPDEDEPLSEFVRQYAKTVFHPVGTCRMGSDADAVVDTKLRVRGIEGLRVADASIMPTVTSGNTNAPTIMIAERAADFIVRGA